MISPDIMKIVNAGQAAAQAVEQRLTALALSDADYAQYLAARAAIRSGLPPVQFVRVEPDSTTYQRQIEDMFDSVRGPHARCPRHSRPRSERSTAAADLEMLDYRLQRDPLGDYRAGFHGAAQFLGSELSALRAAGAG